MRTTERRTKGVALLTGGVLLAGTMLGAVGAAPAQADERKSKTLRTGAIVLGAAAAYFLLKGKQVPAAAAGAGAYYAYKKSKDAERDGRRRQGSSPERYPDSDDPFFVEDADQSGRQDPYFPASEDATYPDDAGYDAGYDDGYNGDYNSARALSRAARRSAAKPGARKSRARVVLK